MNELLLAIRSSYSNISSRSFTKPWVDLGASPEGIMRTSEGEESSFDNITSSTYDNITASSHTSPSTLPTPDVEVDGTPFQRDSSSSCDTPRDDSISAPRSAHEDDIFTPRSRKKWSQCTNNLFFSYRDTSSSDSESELKETSIDGIFIRFDDNIPKIIDKKRCSHISALARVTCVHHRPPKFVKRRAASLHSNSYEKMRDTECSSRTRPSSAGSPKKRASEPNRPAEFKKSTSEPNRPAEIKKRMSEPNRPAELIKCTSVPNRPAGQMKRMSEPARPGILKHSISSKNQELPECLDPLSVYFEDRTFKPSRESLSESTESYNDMSEEGESDQEPFARARKFSVDEHFLEEGRFHLRESEAELGTTLRQLSCDISTLEEGNIPDHHVPEDLYKAVQQRTPNDHVFVQYGSEVRRVVVPCLPVSLDKLLEKLVHVFNDSLTLDMVPLKAIYIQDAQTKIFYQLDDPNDVIKGSHLKINEDCVIRDRGSSQSLEDLHNSSNSSLSSGGFVIPATVNPPPKPIIKRPGGKSRLSLVEEKLHLITSEFNNIKSETGSTVSSQTEFGAQLSQMPVKQLHTVIRTLHQNLLDTRTELVTLRRKELQTRAEMEEIVKETTEEITRHIQASLPQGIRRKRMEADEIEDRYRSTSEQTYTSIKDLEKAVDVMKVDVVKRKVKLDPLQLDSMEKELQSYTQQVAHMNSTFSLLKESLKSVMKEELEIIVNEEQFLEDEQPMLEDITIKCEELTKVMETLKKVATMQKQKGTQQINVYTTSEYDILEERNSVIQEIAALIPNHEERIQSIQATEEYRAVQKKYVKSESDCVAEAIQHQSQNLRKTNAFEELDRKREAALLQLYTAQPPPHKFGRKSSQPQYNSYDGAARRASISKCKSMSSIANHDADNEDYKLAESDEEPLPANNIKRSRSFSEKEKEKQQSSEDEKSKKKTMFAGFFSKKSKQKESKDGNNNQVLTMTDTAADFNNGDVFVVDTAGPPSPAVIPRSNTDVSRKNNKNKNKTSRMTSYSVETDKNRNKKGKNR